MKTTFVNSEGEEHCSVCHGESNACKHSTTEKHDFLKTCSKSLSGEHSFKDGHYQIVGGAVSGYRQEFIKYDHPVCIFCGIYDDILNGSALEDFVSKLTRLFPLEKLADGYRADGETEKADIMAQIVLNDIIILFRKELKKIK